MNIAEELAARDMSVNVYIRADSAHITLIKPSGNWAGKSRLPMVPELFTNIEAEIKRLLEGCDDNAN